MNYWSVNVVKQEVTDSMMTQVNFYLEDLETEVESIKMLQYDCLYDENLNRLAVLWEIMDLYERQQRMLQLQNRLVTIRNSSSILSDAEANILPITKTISATEGIVNLENLERDYTGGTNEIGSAILKNKDGKLYMSTLMKKKIVGDRGLFFINVYFDQKKLMEKLSRLNNNDNSGVLLIYNFDDKLVIDRKDNQEDMNKLPTNLIISSINNDENGITSVTYKNEKYYVAYNTSEYLGITFIKYVPSKIIMAPLRVINLWFWLFTLISIVLLAFFSLSIHKYLHAPLTKLVSAFKKVENGEMNINIKHHVKDEFEYIYRRFNEMVARINMLIEQVYKQKIMTQRAELKQLQSQINPHFLYNSFFLINMMARVQDDNLIPFTKNLGEYFRFVTKNDADLIPLIEENRHAKVYTDIQMMRFSKRLTVNFGEVPQRYENLIVPRLVLQPIIENAFEHAIEKKKEGILNLSYEETDTGVRIIVEDNGDGIEETDIIAMNEEIQRPSKEEISALINIHRRIQLVFGPESGMLFERSLLGGLKAVLSTQMNVSDDQSVKGGENV